MQQTVDLRQMGDLQNTQGKKGRDKRPGRKKHKNGADTGTRGGGTERKGVARGDVLEGSPLEAGLVVNFK